MVELSYLMREGWGVTANVFGSDLPFFFTARLICV